MINWVETQFDTIEDDLRILCGKDEYDDMLWREFEKRFKTAFISTTTRESASRKAETPKNEKRPPCTDEYIAEHTTLVSEVEWDHDSEMSCHSFREGLPPALVRKIIDFDGMPTTLTAWERASQKYRTTPDGL